LLDRTLFSYVLLKKVTNYQNLQIMNVLTLVNSNLVI